MITPGFVVTMAGYNRRMNERLYAAASRLPDDVRRADGGAFWRSIQGTLSHLLWADRMWMSRFAGWEKPSVPLSASGTFLEAFDVMQAERTEVDAGIEVWAAAIEAEWLAGGMSWYSGGLRREVAGPRALLVTHMFNHQTHHRGQVHALLTRAGESTGDTDLWALVPGIG